MSSLEKFEEQVNSIEMYSGVSITERMIGRGLLTIAQELHTLNETIQSCHDALTKVSQNIWDGDVQ